MSATNQGRSLGQVSYCVNGAGRALVDGQGQAHCLEVALHVAIGDLGGAAVGDDLATDDEHDALAEPLDLALPPPLAQLGEFMSPPAMPSLRM